MVYGEVYRVWVGWVSPTAQAVFGLGGLLPAYFLCAQSWAVEYRFARLGAEGARLTCVTFQAAYGFAAVIRACEEDVFEWDLWDFMIAYYFWFYSFDDVFYCRLYSFRLANFR